MRRVVKVAGGRYAPGHIGELTQIVPFEMVDAALAETNSVQQRLRALPSRVVVYLLLAAALFAELGYGQVWARMCAGLGGLEVACPTSSALAAARRRIGVAPLRALFDLLRGPQAGTGLPGSRRGVYWRGRLVCAIDGTILCWADTAANLALYRRGNGYQGGTGYPMVRLLALLACGTRTVIDAVFGTDRTGEISYAHALVGALHRGMIVLADRNFAVAAWIVALADTGADVLVGVKASRRLPVCRRLRDGSSMSRLGPLEVRVITATITITTSAGRRTEDYRLITTVLDPDCSPLDILTLYHQRWEIETTFFELKSTSLGGQVLRARTPTGVNQEIYALLITYQALRIAISDATLARADLDPDRGSFTVALHAARDQLIAATGVIADTTIDLIGVIGQHVLDQLMPARRSRTNPRVVKRAISKYAASSAKRRHRGPSHKTTINIDIKHADTGP
ncbi:MAG: IS4 family transposase [Pseudonocardiales bacterium]|nr:IS4 family transposase [Pseudonocardiales bacterium]